MKPTLPWWEELDFLAPDAREDFGHLMGQLDRGLSAKATLVETDSPAGWSGIARRGSWNRLMPTEWALAEEHPEEFVRRADEGELSFWEMAREHRHTASSVWVWVDAGPDQLGACRVVQIAVLLWLQRACHRHGGQFFWGTIQSPEKGYDQLAGEELQKFLAARSVDPPRRPPERMDEVQTWCLGAPSWMTQVPAGIHRVALTQSGPHTVILEAFGRRLRLALPSSRRAVRLLRDPTVWQMAAPERRLESVGIGRLAFSSSARKVMLVNDHQIALLPVPSSSNEPPGKIRRYDLPWVGRVIACGLDQKAVRIVQAQEGEWVFSRLNPGRESEKHWARVPAVFDAPEAGLGCCWQHGNSWYLWQDDALYRVENGGLAFITYTRGGCALGRSSIIAGDRGDLLDAGARVIHSLGKISPLRVEFARFYAFQVARLGYCIAYQINAEWWRLLWQEDSVDLKVDGRVLGLHCDIELGPQLVVENSGWLRLVSPKTNEAIHLGEAVDQCVIHPNGLLAYTTVTGYIGCYELHQRCRLWLVQS